MSIGLLGVYTKYPNEQLDYDIEFVRWIEGEGLPLDSITSASAAVLDADTGLRVLRTDISGTVVKVWISGGVDGESATIAVTVTTSGGRLKESQFKIRVRA